MQFLDTQVRINITIINCFKIDRGFCRCKLRDLSEIDARTELGCVFVFKYLIYV